MRLFFSVFLLFITGNAGHLKDPFYGSTSDTGKIAVSFCSGIFSYSGWNYLNFMTEELKDPYV
jgi:amino acid transporter